MMRTTCLVLLLIAGAGCASRMSSRTDSARMDVTGESVVLAGTEPGNLAFDAVVKGSLVVRSSYAPEVGAAPFIEGADYVVDYAKGTIQRTASSKIPDYKTYPLYGLTNFDHGKFKDFSNQKWFVWVDYRSTNGKPWAEASSDGGRLARVRRKLDAGGKFKIASYGDSITAGGDASRPEFQFPRRYGKYLQEKFPRAVVEVQDVSIPGYTSQQGVEWFDKKIGTVEAPDLVLVGFGMNDHNKVEVGGNEPAKFKTNLVALVRRIQQEKNADVILFSTFPPNENWRFGSHRMALYAQATREAANEAGCAYVDVFSVWEKVRERKDQPSLLANNINHPNDFGHWLYEQAFEGLRF